MGLNMDEQTIERLFPLSADRLRLKQCRYGPMLYLANDLFIGRSLDRYGEYSEGEMELFRQIIAPGQVILDIGANIGTHTVVLAQLTGPRGAVFAFEPQRLIFQILCANVALNGLPHVQPHHAAVGSQLGSIAVPMLDVAIEQNFGALDLGPHAEGDRVRLTTIDELKLPVCHFIKVDVEGMEGEVIAGGENTIRHFHPVLYLENERSDRSPLLIRRLFDLGYRLYWHIVPMFNPKNYCGEQENVLGNVASFSVLGLHSSVPQNVEGLTEIVSPEQGPTLPSDPP